MSQYQKLSDISRSYHQASEGKGPCSEWVRSSVEKQSSFVIRSLVSQPFNFQAVKKIVESERLPKEQRINELRGAMNYLAQQIQIEQEAGIVVVDYPATVTVEVEGLKR
jgi:hypothetical protein